MKAMLFVFILCVFTDSFEYSMGRQTIDEPIPIVNKMISTFGWIQTNNVTMGPPRVIILVRMPQK